MKQYIKIIFINYFDKLDNQILKIKTNILINKKLIEYFKKENSEETLNSLINELH